MATGGRRTRPDSQQAAVDWAQVAAWARHTARKHGLPPDLAEDLAQEVRMEFMGRPCNNEMVQGSLNRGAAREAKRRNRERRLPQKTRRPIGGFRSKPLLCPCLGALAAHHPDPGRYLATLLRAATKVSHDPKALRARQLRAFLIAYEDGGSVEDSAKALHVSSLDAMVERLRRVSTRLEDVLLKELKDRVPVGELRGLPKKLDRRRVPKPWIDPQKTQDPQSSGLERLSLHVEAAMEDLLEP